MGAGSKERDFKLGLALAAWFLCVAGTVIASLPQMFIVKFHMPGWMSIVVGGPIVMIGTLLLIVAGISGVNPKYPEELEITMTHIPRAYREEFEKMMEAA